MNRNWPLFHLNLLLVTCALSGLAQSKRQEADAGEALKRVLSQKSTLVVVRSADSKDFVAFLEMFIILKFSPSFMQLVLVLGSAHGET